MLAPLFTAGLLLCFAGALASKREPRICSGPPALHYDGINPIVEASRAGNITVVGLLDAGSRYAILQAILLRGMKRRLAKKVKGVTYMIINKRFARRKRDVFGKGYGIQVYESERKNSWKKFNGSNNDWFIYNRCGKLAHHIKHPKSFLIWPAVRSAILKAHISPCGAKCPKDKRVKEPIPK